MIKRVYIAILVTPTCGEIPATMVFLRQLVAYIAGFLPVATYCRNTNTRIAGLIDDQYNTTLEILQESSDEA